VAQIKVTRGTLICAQIEIYEYTNRIFSVDVEHFSVDVEPYLLSYTCYRIPPSLAAAASVAASATVGTAAAALSAHHPPRLISDYLAGRKKCLIIRISATTQTI